MDRNAKPHVPPTHVNITDPEADEANRHLSWTPENPVGHVDARDYEAELEPGNGVYTQYVGLHDGTFEVTVTVQRGQAEAIQSERGMGETQTAIREAMLKAYEKADRALLVLTTEDDDEEVDALDD